MNNKVPSKIDLELNQTRPNRKWMRLHSHRTDSADPTGDVDLSSLVSPVSLASRRDRLRRNSRPVPPELNLHRDPDRNLAKREFCYRLTIPFFTFFLPPAKINREIVRNKSLKLLRILW